MDPERVDSLGAKRTMGYDEAPPGVMAARPLTPPVELGSIDLAIDVDDSCDLAETLAAPAGAARDPSVQPSLAGRVTVLPRRRKARSDAADHRPRFERVKVLGEGGMGEVALAKDNDIRRTVAVKYLRSDVAGSEPALLRFADEVRVVGQLEHPAIVPIYDVGVDDAGQHFLVMKHLQGETMEDIIEKLRAGDPATSARFTHEHRAHLFLQVLDAMRYAHARGIIHRDLKPANIMIGPYGEVTILDWGIAKPIASKGGARFEPDARTLVDSNDRLLETRHGTLAGTPLYMSPEQAAGHNDGLDQRSDIYALAVLFYEWMVLEHPIQGKKSLTEVLATIITQEHDARDLVGRAMKVGAPCEYVFLLVKGLRHDPAERFQSVDEFEAGLRKVLDGKVPVTCHITLAKRGTREAGQWIDRHPMIFTGLFFGGVLLTLGGVIGGAIAGVMALLG